ncbi:hypothetical protein [Salinisphaera shabanensis]
MANLQKECCLIKIRQQLQRLRDCGWLMFLGNGVYRRLD